MNTIGTHSGVVAKRVVLNLDRCIECGSCASACFTSHANMPAISFAGAGPALLPVVCRQCNAAPCVEVCPADAMVRDEQGVVFRRLFRCTGCGSCAWACPFGVLSEQGAGVPTSIRSTDRLTGHQVAKCDLCRDRVTGDDAAVPRCVAACPAGALVFVDEHQAPQARLNMLGGRTTGDNPYKRR
jgi:formate dehydrogenase iron-sulfur subunit